MHFLLFWREGVKCSIFKLNPSTLFRVFFLIYVEYNIGLSNSVCRDKAIFIKYQSIKNG